MKRRRRLRQRVAALVALAVHYLMATFLARKRKSVWDQRISHWISAKSSTHSTQTTLWYSSNHSTTASTSMRLKSRIQQVLLSRAFKLTKAFLQYLDFSPRRSSPASQSLLRFTTIHGTRQWELFGTWLFTIVFQAWAVHCTLTETASTSWTGRATSIGTRLTRLLSMAFLRSHHTSNSSIFSGSPIQILFQYLVLFQHELYHYIKISIN